jgi:hypothetical protein
MNAKELWKLAEQLFTARQALTTLWQEQSEHFYPERADFTYKRSIGTDFASNLLTSYPVMARRELASQIGSMLRRTDQEWFYMDLPEGEPDHDAKLWLDWANTVMRRAMYDRVTQFTRATTEADNDWACFGNYVTSCRLNSRADALLYRTWHLRDCVWKEDEEGQIAYFARRWKPQARDLLRLFGEDKVHTEVKKLAEKSPFEPVNCLHIVVEADMYDEKPSLGMPFFSLYIDTSHEGHVIEAVPQRTREYIIGRWQTVSGSQYAYSPATVAALPDARLIQAMTLTLLEAGEKVTNPPMVATTDVIKSDVSIYAGGITWVDRDYDEKLGEALRPLTRDYARGMPFGLEMLQDVRVMIHQAFYLNKLTLPQRAPEMTAYEVGQRIQEYIRGALPLFEPMEHESNGQLCELTFETLMAAGAFGSPLDMPRSLQGAEIQFKYRSPLHDAIEAQKAQVFRESAALLAEAAAIDPSAALMVKPKVALREALEGIGVDADWMASEEEVDQKQAALEEQQKQQQLLASLEQGSNVAKNIGEAEAAMTEAQGV